MHKIFPHEPSGNADHSSGLEQAVSSIAPRKKCILSEPVIKRLTLSRHLFELALRNSRQQQEAADAAAVTLLQDAVEIFFLAAFDFLNVHIGHKTEFNQYLDKLSDHVPDLPFRRRLAEINRVRVHAKHEGIPPNRKEVPGYVTDARKFLEEVCKRVFAVDYWTISLIELLDEGEAKTFLSAAEAAYNSQEYVTCLVECRKAFFVTFETAYDTQKDLKNVIFGSLAPYYARDKKYIEENVGDAFDYIVLDHKGVDADLMKQGIDSNTFWNVWRLTPQVYRHEQNNDWIVQHHPGKQMEDGLAERAAHVLASMTSIMLTKQDSRRMAKYIESSTRYELKTLAGAALYKKADKNSRAAGDLPEGATVNVEYAVQGLNDDELYWNAFYIGKEGRLSVLSGYILESDLIFE